MNLTLFNAAGPDTWILLGVCVVAIVGMAIWTRISGKKRREAEEERLKKLAVGDKVLMGCGIVGTIVKIEEISPVDMNIVIETGDEGEHKSYLKFDVRGLYQVLESVNQESEQVAPEALYDNEEAVSEEPVDAAEAVETEPEIEADTEENK